MGKHVRLLLLEALFNKCWIWLVALPKSYTNIIAMRILFVHECICINGQTCKTVEAGRPRNKCWIWLAALHKSPYNFMILLIMFAHEHMKYCWGWKPTSTKNWTMARSLPYIMVEHYGVVDVVCTQMFNLKMGNHERLLRLESLFNKCSIWLIAIHKSKKQLWYCVSC